MKRILLASALCLLTFLSAYTQSKQESLKELFHLMETDSMIEKSVSGMIPILQKQVEGHLKDSASMAEFNVMIITIMKKASDISKKMIDEDLINIYDKHLSQNEIDDIIRFYKTPSGQKLIKIMPELQNEMMKLMMQKYMPELQKTVMEQTNKFVKNRQKESTHS